MMRSYKVIGYSILLLVALLTSGYLYLVYTNSIESTKSSAEDIQLSLDRSINWVLQNQDEIVQIHNPALWWFLNESALLTKNIELAKLVKQYRTTVIAPTSMWQGYFKENSSIAYIPNMFDGLAKYQQFRDCKLFCVTVILNHQFFSGSSFKTEAFFFLSNKLESKSSFFSPSAPIISNSYNLNQTATSDKNRGKLTILS